MRQNAGSIFTIKYRCEFGREFDNILGLGPLTKSPRVENLVTLSLYERCTYLKDRGRIFKLIVDVFTSKGFSDMCPSLECAILLNNSLKTALYL
jgi:hypothetical protein